MEFDKTINSIVKEPQLLQTKAPPVKDKSTNLVQITAEQLLQDNKLHEMGELDFPLPRFMDKSELRDYKSNKRKEFEDNIRKQKHHMGTWIKYALWEEKLSEFRRARSVFERALNIDYKNVSLWLKYGEMEMRNKFINSARNVWERATYLLPRVDQFWFKYIYMEETLGFYLKARKIFDKWMSWKPSEKGWTSYVKFEERMGEKELCRKVMYRYLDAHPKVSTYLKVAKFEAKNKHFDDSRFVFEKALEDLGDQCMTETFFISWAKFEIRLKEYQRAREIFKYGLKSIQEIEEIIQKSSKGQMSQETQNFDVSTNSKTKRLYEEYLKLEKQFGNTSEIDRLIIDKRSGFYKGVLKDNPRNYDMWFNLIFIEKERGDVEALRKVFEEAVLQTPPANEKRFWKRYIYLWITYATYEELEFNDPAAAEAVYARMIKLIPHRVFTFSKIWIMFAHFQLRRKNVDKARKVFGMAIGLAPKEKIFRAYIRMEMQLTNFERCRKIYERFLLEFPDKPGVWINFAEMEFKLEEYKRARLLYESAIVLPALNMPETVWKAYIDMEIRLSEFTNARELFRRLLRKTKHVKVWISFAQFEKERDQIIEMRRLFSEADEFFKSKDDLKEQRKILVETWLSIEQEIGDEQFVKVAQAKQPRETIRERKVMITNEEGNEETGHYEEFVEYIFPDDQSNFKIPKFMLKAAKWKERQKMMLQNQTPTQAVDSESKNEDTTTTDLEKSEEQSNIKSSTEQKIAEKGEQTFPKQILACLKLRR